MMHKWLAPGGKVYVTFGPPWFSPWGAHVAFLCKLPWCHLFFSEKTVTYVRSFYRHDGAASYRDMGVAKMSLAKFRRLVRASNFSITYSRLDCCWGLHFLQYTPLRELFITQINSILTANQPRM